MAGAGTASALLTGCKIPFCSTGWKAKIAVQLYSIERYVMRVGLAKALKDVADIGYAGVEAAGYDAKAGKCLGVNAKEFARMLNDCGLELCGIHVSRSDLAPETIAATCDFSLECGTTTVICPGSGNMPEGLNWGNHHKCRGMEIPGIADHTKMLCDFYGSAADNAEKVGCRVGIHNHQWEFLIRLPDGRTFWDAFFTGTSQKVLMEQDVGWTTAAGYDPCEQYLKYPHRSPTLHAKENGYGCAGAFDGILGVPGKNSDGTSVTPVDWERLFPVAKADGVSWYVVECEKHRDSLLAIRPSLEFLQKKGFN